MAQLFQYYMRTLQGVKANTAAPTFTFEDLSIDDRLTELERVVKYAKSSIGLQRLVHVKMLSYVATTASFNLILEKLVPLFDILVNDQEPAIRSHLADQMNHLTKIFVANGDIGYKAVLDHILPIMELLLGDDKVEVRATATTSLVEMTTLIRQDDLGPHILTIILSLAHSDENEEKRMIASELLNLLAVPLGNDLCKQFVIAEVVSLAEDPVFRVRKSTALNFQNICKVGGDYELFERLMPTFVRLSKDDMYRVRRACAESLYLIAQYVSDDIKIGVLVEIFLRLAQDPSKVVRQSVLQQSGMFIAFLPARVVNDTILESYCSMVQSPTGDIAADAELVHYCAYSFPGVIQNLGVAKWPVLREVYHILVHSHKVEVKQTLAMSLHEVGRILGTKLVEEELVSVFEEMIQPADTLIPYWSHMQEQQESRYHGSQSVTSGPSSLFAACVSDSSAGHEHNRRRNVMSSKDVEVVRMGVIKNLAKFLELLSEPCQVSYLPLLEDILHNSSPYNWRLRQSLASQMKLLVKLPPHQNVYNTLFPLCMTLLQDSINQVRYDTFDGIVQLLLVLSPGYTRVNSDGVQVTITSEEGQSYLESVTKAINVLTVSEAYRPRQLWGELCKVLIVSLPREIFEKYFIDGMLKLACDSVFNVRVCIAEALGSIEQTTASGNVYSSLWLLEREDIRECVKRFARDDKDVIIALSKLQVYFPDLIFEKMSCRGMKHAPGGGEPIQMTKTSSYDEEEDKKRKSMTLPPLPVFTAHPQLRIDELELLGENGNIVEEMSQMGLAQTGNRDEDDNGVLSYQYHSQHGVRTLGQEQDQLYLQLVTSMTQKVSPTLTDGDNDALTPEEVKGLISSEEGIDESSTDSVDKAEATAVVDTMDSFHATVPDESEENDTSHSEIQIDVIDVNANKVVQPYGDTHEAKGVNVNEEITIDQNEIIPNNLELSTEEKQAVISNSEEDCNTGH